MTKKNATKKMLLTSILSLILCMAMLIGTTFAWFTDSVTSANNKLVAGNLDIQLLMHDGDKYVNISNGAAPIFTEASLAQNSTSTLWEPGKTQVAYLALKNSGNLDLKYELALNVINPEDGKNLYEVMQYVIEEDVKYENGQAPEWDDTKAKALMLGTSIIDDSAILKHGQTHYFTFSVHMPEGTGNQYQGGKVNFDFTVRAAQAATESDSFGTGYDEQATYAIAEVRNEAEFLSALARGGEFRLGADIELTGTSTIVEKDTVIDLNGHELTANRDGNKGKVQGSVLCAKGVDTHLTIKGDGSLVNTSPSGHQYNIGVLADGGATVTIQGGNYYAGGAAGYVQHGLIIIEGGFFECDMAKPEPGQVHNGEKFYLAAVINCSKQSYINYRQNENTERANVIVRGGTFVNEDPTWIHEGWYYRVSWVDQDIYQVVSETQTNGDIWFTVVPK